MNLSNFSFGSRLRAAQDLLTILGDLEGYDPPRQEESLEGFRAFIDTVIAANKAETSLMKEYRLLVKQRQDLFYTGPNAIIRIFSALKSNIKWQYGNNSGEIRTLDNIITRMKYSRGDKKNLTDAESATVSSEQEASGSIPKSQGERTYGSLTKNFDDFLTSISGFEGYLPASELFTVDNLKALSAKLNSVNNDVAGKLSQLRTMKYQRLELYAQLKERVYRIKLFIRSKYGADSSIFKQIRSLSL